MEKYLQVSYYTLTGVKKIIELGDFTYGEWIIYNGNEPKYHVDLNTEIESDMMINRLMNKKSETIESIIEKINQNQQTNLTLKTPPFLRLIKNEESMVLELGKLPEQWLKNI